MSKKIKLYGIDIESDDDIDYVPDEAELKEDEQKPNHVVVLNTQQIYEEMKKIDLYQPKPCTKSAAQIAKEVLEEQKKVQVKRVKFAGKSFLINDKGEIQEENIEQPAPKPIKAQTGTGIKRKFLVLQRSNQKTHKQSKSNQFNSQIKIRLEIIYYKREVGKLNGIKKKEWLRCFRKSKVFKQNQRESKIDQTQQKKKFMSTQKNQRPSFFPSAKYSTGNQSILQKRTNRGASADKNQIPNTNIRQSFKPATPESKKLVNQFEQSPEQNQQDKASILSKSKVVSFQKNQTPINRIQKSITIQSDYESQKSRNPSVSKPFKESTPVKSSKTLQQTYKPNNLKQMTQITQITKSQETQMFKKKSLYKNKTKELLVTKTLIQTTQITQREQLQSQQNNVQQKRQEIVQTQRVKPIKIDSPQELKQEIQQPHSARLPTRSSYSPTPSIPSKNITAKNSRKVSPINSLKNSNGQTKFFQQLQSAIVSPMYKNAQYFMSSLNYFVKDYYKVKPISEIEKTKFHSIFQDQKEYFKNKFIEHLNVSFNSLHHCQRIKVASRPQQRILNPPKKPSLSSNQIKTLIFDLDETLIHCNDLDDSATDYQTMIQLPGEPQSQIRYNVRPYCQQILKILSQYYELILFTASYKEYADKILEVIDPENCFSYKFYNDSCVKLEDDMLLKDLSVIGGRQLQNMALIDNNSYCYFFQLDNGIPIINFEDNKKDKELLYLADYLIKCETNQAWLAYHKNNFKNHQIYLSSQTFEDCVKKISNLQFN